MSNPELIINIIQFKFLICVLDLNKHFNSLVFDDILIFGTLMDIVLQKKVYFQILFRR